MKAEKTIHKLAKKYKGEFLNSGTLIPDMARDIEFGFSSKASAADFKREVAEIAGVDEVFFTKSL